MTAVTTAHRDFEIVPHVAVVLDGWLMTSEIPWPRFPAMSILGSRCRVDRSATASELELNCMQGRPLPASVPATNQAGRTAAIKRQPVVIRRRFGRGPPSPTAAAREPGPAPALRGPIGAFRSLSDRRCREVAVARRRPGVDSAACGRGITKTTLLLPMLNWNESDNASKAMRENGRWMGIMSI